MDQHFTHLHLHSDYSLLDGAITVDKLINFGKQNKLKALAITDHGNIFGAVKFFQQAQKAGIKPILGIETYFTENAKVKDANNKYNHLILLVQNEKGYKNLCKLISYAYQEGFYFKPRIDYEILEKYSEGLIVTSACLGGHIPQLLMQDQYEKAYEKIDWFLKVFGPERFYLEVQPADQSEQKILNEKLFNIAKEKGVQLVAAGDCHYTSLDDHDAHEVMLSIQTQHKITDPDRFTFGDCRAYMRTAQEMLAEFKDHPEAVWNSGKIADMCDFTFKTGKLFFPQFQIPENFTQEEYFKTLCRQGLEDLFANGRIASGTPDIGEAHSGDKLHQKENYEKRLELEADLICKMGFVGYFLVVSDFIVWAKKNGIPVGPGRGSAAGSLVAWALQITDIDPIKYNLLFERFLNPERVSMPDIDIDFCIEGRDKVIEYVREKYGHDKVCQIITFGTMMAKGVIKDVARVLGLPFEDSNAITDLIPDQLKITLKEAVEAEPQLQELIKNNAIIAKIFDHAYRLEGITRHASKHAAGIVISPEAIDDVLPIYIPPKTNDLVTQYAMTELEYLGFLKMDFLGLKNLTLIKKTLDLIKQKHNFLLDINKIPLDCPKTFKLLCKGQTSGVFQLESEGLKDVLRRLQPACFEDIIAVNALYRPGPLGSGMVDDFIERKHGKQKISYLFDDLEPILNETYGVIVYQEQVMKIASKIAGYSLGEADILRRAMGKKKAEEMAAQKEKFVTKAVGLSYDKKKAEELFELMAYFAGYGFNKSHSAAYALIAYQTAYLKANYTSEFMACLISLEATNSDQMAFYVQEAKDINIAILPPDINQSQVNFSVCEGKIRFGLHGIKNVGMAALENIIADRTKNGPFKNLLDFCKRVDLRTCNKRVVENLIAAGAFDNLQGNRAQKTAELEKIMDIASEHKKALLTGQMDLFGMNISTDNMQDIDYSFESLEEWSDKVKLEKEKEVIGVYISAQPLDSYAKQVRWIAPTNFADAIKLSGKNIICIGLLKSNKIITTKKGDKMSFTQFEDQKGKAEVIVFPKLYSKVAFLLSDYNVFVISGTVDEQSQTQCKIIAQNLVPLDLFFEQWPNIHNLSISVSENFISDKLQDLKTKFSKGSCRLQLLYKENEKILKLNANQKIAINSKLIEELDALQLSPKIIIH
ncbi:DNA polymerase III subunit alpha [Candidatus Dependentiae bacterium]|nr:DNA polymerase III subunit alpha [Candidatus Dependentiae bacterium]